MAAKAKLAFAVSRLDSQYHTGSDFARLVGFLSQLSCDEHGLKSPLQPPQQGVIKRVVRFSTGPETAVPSAAAMEEIREEEVVASNDVTLFGYLGTFIEYSVELNVQWRLISAVVFVLEQLLVFDMQKFSVPSRFLYIYRTCRRPFKNLQRHA